MNDGNSLLQRIKLGSTNQKLGGYWFVINRASMIDIQCDVISMSFEVLHTGVAGRLNNDGF
jgi:hypothetical protein